MSHRVALVGLVLALSVGAAMPAPPAPGSPQAVPSTGHAELGQPAERNPEIDLDKELLAAAIRLPLAAVLGTALALRPRRRGTPPRRTAVVQTQIILAIVGAVVMLVVGASLARAFGIVGVASLIRYRSKIDDPKDAVVMLAALAVGLAAGVGLFVLSVFSTAFLVAALWVIESFGPHTRLFELSVKLGGKTADLRPRIETALKRLQSEFELRSASEEEAVYVVTAPADISTDEASKALTALAPAGKGAVEWKEIAPTKAK